MKNFWNRKIPTLVGLLIITVGTLVTTFLVRGDTLFQIKAGPGQDPKNVNITNVSDTSFTLTYTTDDEVIGTLSYGNDPSLLENIVLDDRDQLSGSVNKYKAHSITVKDLDSNSPYYFTITSGEEKYLNNTQPYKVETGSKITKDPSFQIPMSGKVVTADSQAATDGLVYVKINGAQDLSTFIKNDGTYTLPLNSLRNSALDEYFTIEATSIISIEIYSQNLFSSVSVSPGEINPVPPITLSNSYDFSNATLNLSPPPQESSISGSFPTFGTISANEENPEILTPTKDEEFTKPQPTFEGTARPNEVVEITIHSDENIKTQVRTDSNGNWTFTPPKNLSEGVHTITIAAKNKNGIIKTITQSFTVFAAASETIQTPTPSPTSIPSKTPTPSISPTETPQISPAPTLLPTGNSSVVIATLVGFAAAFSGLILFILTRGKSSL